METKKLTLDQQIKFVISKKTSENDIVDALKQIDPRSHAVKNKRLRKDKVIQTDSGMDIVKVARIPLALQKLIVKRAAAFLIGKPIELSGAADNEQQVTMLEMVRKTWNDNKLDFRSKKIAKVMMSETECAEVWYVDEVETTYWAKPGYEPVRLRMRILHPSAGDSLYPVFNELGNLIAFGRQYFTLEGKRKVENFDLWTDEMIYNAVKKDGAWIAKEGGEKENPLKKIPVIYYSQELPEWADVQDAIERLETLISNFADTNDYFASPMVFVEGDVEGFAQKGESGKVLKGKKGATAKYLTWDGAPEAIKLEIETLFDIIYTVTQTPNITFKEMKGLGNVSGVALEMLFLDAQLKAKDKQEDVFGECIQRRINLLKAFMVNINSAIKSAESMTLTAEFGLFKLDNVKEDIENLSTAVNSKIMSKATAMELNPFVRDVEQETERLKAESTSSLDEEFNQ